MRYVQSISLPDPYLESLDRIPPSNIHCDPECGGHCRVCYKRAISSSQFPSQENSGGDDRKRKGNEDDEDPDEGDIKSHKKRKAVGITDSTQSESTGVSTSHTHQCDLSFNSTEDGSSDSEEESWIQEFVSSLSPSVVGREQPSPNHLRVRVILLEEILGFPVNFKVLIRETSTVAALADHIRGLCRDVIR